MTLPFDALTFDCYGTLVDWEGGIAGAFAAAAARDGIELERDAVLRVHAEVEPAIQAGPFRSYRAVLEEVARAAAQRLGWSLDPSEAGFLPESLPRWPPFPDTNTALERLHALGLQLGVLSNVDEDLLAGTLEHITVPFDLVVTAEQVRSYKPAAGHFEAARRALGSARWLHVAQSWFHDIAPAHALGIPTVWVNRNEDEPGDDARPLAAVGDLVGVVAWLDAMSGG